MKKYGKKLIACILSFAMALSLAACGSGDSAPASGGQSGGSAAQTTIQWWTPNWDEAVSREFVEEFEAENPDIHIELVITDWDTYKDKITTAISTSGAPEIVTVLLTDVAPFANKGLLEPLNEHMTAAGTDMEDFIDAALDITSVDGEAYGLPFRYDGSGIYYNVDILAQYGYDSFPTTWDEMLKLCDLIKADGKYGFAWPLGNQANAATRFVQQLYTYGGDVLNEDETECLLNSDAAVSALNAIASSVQNGQASPSSLEYDNTTMRDAFGSGELAFNFTGPFDAATLDADYPELNYATAVIPGIDGMGCTTANGWCVAMPKNCKEENKEAAARFMAYIVEPENQARLTQSFPASETSIQDEKFSTDILKPFAEQLNNSRPEPTFTRWSEMEPIMYEYIQNAVSGSMTVEDACEGMTNDINALLQS
ncbi:MAG TPA: sugar ABC transporter substrate-binding protein [Candidatus Fournierella pullicola]|uniref:Sugar ABC transporter substrate-binding protein n=1 Tax=Candidatus Allofournierella pullicola TaxID=2838596 RepID=A0A9D1V4R9_9FIRM|nr:sugar ABC transporter substrate-binding protein [Candidatus Fournierella pullicola]